MNIWAPILISTVLVCAHTLQCHAEEYVKDKEFTRLERAQKNRLFDFYKRQEEQEKDELAQIKYENDMRQERRRMEEEYARARRNYVLNRKPKPPEDSRVWDQEVKSRMLAYEKSRREYVQRRNEIRKLIKKIGVISEDEEVGLDTDDTINN